MEISEGFDRLGEEQEKKNQHFCFRHGEIKLPAGYPAGWRTCLAGNWIHEV